MIIGTYIFLFKLIKLLYTKVVKISMSHAPEIVSKNLQKIHSKDTSIELQIRKVLWHKRYRYRKNYKILPGSPDIVLTKHKIAIFCDSDFFHGKDWKILKLRLEKDKNPDYWIKKNRT